MRFMGSKIRHAKDFLPIILKDRKPGQYFVDAFCGGCNVVDKVDGNRIASDAHPYLMAMWTQLVEKRWVPERVEREEFYLVRKNRDTYPPYLVGWCGYNCSYNGKWFQGFSYDYPENTRGRNGKLANFQDINIRAVAKQVPKLKGVKFVCSSYEDLDIPPNSIIYCDPPYEGTTGYMNTIDHAHFWEWVRTKCKEGHTVYVSEYKAPDDFDCVWSKTVKSHISNGKSKTHEGKMSIEKLFVWNPSKVSLSTITKELEKKVETIIEKEVDTTIEKKVETMIDQPVLSKKETLKRKEKELLQSKPKKTRV